MDIQYTVGLAGGVPVTFFSVGDSTAEGFSDFIHTLIAEPNPPQVVSVSYAFDEADLPNDFSTLVYSFVECFGNNVHTLLIGNFATRLCNLEPVVFPSYFQQVIMVFLVPGLEHFASILFRLFPLHVHT